jgi:hypothetical protein
MEESMKLIILLLVFIVLAVNSTLAFNIDSLKSGMSIEQAKAVLKDHGYDKIQVEDNYISAWYSPQVKGYIKSIFLNFCKGKLVNVQKHLEPRFDYLTRILMEKRRELGRPVDSWSTPADITSNSKSNSISFLWKDGPTFIKVSWHDFGTNNQLDISYDIKHDCWQLPY